MQVSTSSYHHHPKTQIIWSDNPSISPAPRSDLIQFSLRRQHIFNHDFFFFIVYESFNILAVLLKRTFPDKQIFYNLSESQSKV